MDCDERAVVQRVPWLRFKQVDDSMALSTTDKVLEYHGKASRLLPNLPPVDRP